MTDWAAHKKHRDRVIADHGQWVGLLDEDGAPLMDLPPATELDHAASMNAPSEGYVKLPALLPDGTPHPVVAELVADGLGKLDAEARLLPQVNRTRFVAVEWAGGGTHPARDVMAVTEVVASGEGEQPTLLEARGVDLLALVGGLPCPSVPTTWTGQWVTVDRDWGQTFATPRTISKMWSRAQVDGFTVRGPADQAIASIWSTSLQAWWRTIGVTAGDEPVVVWCPDSAVPAPPVAIAPDDKSLLEETADLATAAGVGITASMWWPGDPPVPGATPSAACISVRIAKVV